MQAFPPVMAASSRFCCLLLIVTWIFLPGFSSSRLHAQGASSDKEAADTAVKKLEVGDFAGAVVVMESFFNDFPRSGLKFDMQWRLAYALLQTKAYDKAAAAAQKAITAETPEPIKQIALGMLGEIYLLKGASLEVGSAERDDAYQKAIAAYQTYLAAYPQSSDAESAFYGMAMSNIQLGNFKEASKLLQDSLIRFPASESVNDNKYLLAICDLTEAGKSAALPEGTAGKLPKPQLIELLQKAGRILNELSKSTQDLALANDARLQLGELYSLYARNVEGDEEKGKFLQLSIDALKDVRPPAALIPAQEAKIAQLGQRRAQAAQAKNAPEFQRISTLMRKEEAKLLGLKDRKDRTQVALFKIAELYFQLQMLDEARVVFRFLQGITTNPEEQKSVAQHMALTYILQKQMDKAVSSWKDFVAKYQYDPMAESLPLLIGSSYLEIVPPQPEKALEFFEETITHYPNGKLKNLATLQKASALQQLGRNEEAEKTFTDYLASNPDAEGALRAEIGLAFVYQNTGKTDEAIAQFRKVRDQYSDAAETETAHFWLARGLVESGKADEGVKEFTTFREKFPQSPNMPTALIMMARAHRELKMDDPAMILYSELQENHAQTQEATFAYFQKAAILQSRGEIPAMVAELDAFIEKYPQDPKVYSVFKTKADLANAEQKTEEAIAIYEDYISKYPENPQSAIALVEIAKLQRLIVNRSGRYIALPEEGRAKWKSAADKGVAAAESVLTKYPDNPAVAQALQQLVDYQNLLIESNLQTLPGREKYFDELAAAASQDALKSKIIFTNAVLLIHADPKAALAKMDAAYSPSSRYSPDELDLYGLALLDANRIDDAVAVFEKLAADYPNRPGGDPNKEGREVQMAQSVSLYGLGKVNLLKGNQAAMLENFVKLRELYPWSPKVGEGNYYIAKNLVENQKYDEALALIGPILRNTNVVENIKASALYLNAEVLKAKGNTDAAIDTFIKVAYSYPKTDAAVKGLWDGALMQEAKMKTLTADKKAAEVMLNRTKSSLNKILKDYPNSEFATKAKQKLDGLSN